MPHDSRTYFAFSEPVTIPGAVLPAGEYIFRLADPDSGRRVVRLEADGTLTTLADRFEGKRFNSPNDAAVRRDGSIYFTDPDYGLGGQPR